MQIRSKASYFAAPIAISLSGVLSMSLIAHLLYDETIPLWVISPHKIVNLTFTMQMIVLLISLLALACMYVYNKTKFRTFFRLSLTSRNANNNWKFYGPVIAVAFTLGNALLMSVSVMAQNGSVNKTFFSLMPLVLLFSITNAWSEEIFTRFVIVAGLDGKVKPIVICWISALIFGVPHFFGTPGGVFGVFASGTLGWLLAKSVIETKGLGWALFIHFLQDLVIFGAGAMIIAGGH